MSTLRFQQDDACTMCQNASISYKGYLDQYIIAASTGQMAAADLAASQADIAAVIATLAANDQTAITMRYGWTGNPISDWAAIAAAIGCTEDQAYEYFESGWAGIMSAANLATLSANFNQWLLKKENE